MNTIRRFLRRDRDYFANHRAEIQRENYAILRLSNICLIFVMLVFFVLALLFEFNPVLCLLHCVYLPLHIVLGVHIWQLRRAETFNARRAAALQAVFELSSLSFFLLLSLLPFPDRVGVYLGFPILLLVTIFAYPARKAFAFIFSYTLLYAVLAWLFKTPTIRRFDIYNTLGTFIASSMGYIIVARMRHENSTIIGRLHYLNTTDALTGLYNKQTYEALCRAHLADVSKSRGYAFLFFDIDNFKQINDTYGHQLGDDVIRGIASILRQVLYEKDYLCRFGGDEYVAFMADVNDRAAVDARVAQFRAEVRAFGKTLKLENLSCSVGVAMKGEDNETYPELLSRADADLYIHKRNGKRHNVVVGTESLPLLPERARCVLVVDDNAMNRILLGEILRLSYEVIEVKNGQEAMTLLHREPERISAVMLDILMPVMDGYEVLEAMRADPALKRIPVVVTTGQTDADTENKAFALGADDVVIKPYRASIIMHRVRNIITLYESQQGLRRTADDR